MQLILLAAILLWGEAKADCSPDVRTVTQNISAVCKQATADNFRDVSSSYTGGFVFSGYTMSMAPDQDHRLEGVQGQESSSLELIQKDDHGVSDVYQYLTNLKNNPPKYSADHAAQFIQKFDKSVAVDTVEMGGMTALGTHECGSLPGCKDAFIDLVNLMAPGDGFKTILSLPSLWKELGTDDRYLKPLASVALLLKKKVDLAKQGKLSDPGDLFTDIKSQFISSGFSDADAQEMTWKFLAFYSTRGASTMPFFEAADGQNKGMFVSTSLIAGMISYLDGYATARSRKMYSVPSQVTTTCDYTRPYHFWLAAYLSHYLEKKGYSKPAIFKAVHLSETIYEQFSSGYTKKDPATVDKMPLHNFYNVETQKNIAFNDVGAFWSLEPKQNIDLDQSLQALYSNAKEPSSFGFQSLVGAISDPLKRYTGVNLGTIMKWNDLIAPDTAYSQLSGRLH